MADDAGLLDLVSFDTPATDTTTVDAPEVDTTVDATAEVDATTADTDATTDGVDATKDTTTSDGTKKDAKQQYNPDGSPKEEVKAKAESLPGDKNTPDGIRKLLKSMRDADPANAAAVKQLHGAFERYQAFAKVFPKVSEAQQAKEFIDLVGGAEGYEKLQGTIQLAEASDQLLYSGDPKLIENIIEDLKSNGKIDALGKLATPFMEALRTNDEKAYYSVMSPHFLNGIEQVELPAVFKELQGFLSDPALNDPDPAKAGAAALRAIKLAKQSTDGLNGWVDKLRADNKKAKESVVSPERQQLDKERADFIKQQEEFKTNQTKEFQNGVAAACEKHNNAELKKALAPFLQMPFFKGTFKPTNLYPLAATIKSDLFATLKSDSAYQTAMKAMWSAKAPDRAKIEEYHKARASQYAEEVVRNAVQRMYPGYSKGGAAAGRIAATADKKAVQSKVEATAAATGKPIYVAQKPSRDSIDWDHTDERGKPDAQMNLILGRAYLKGKDAKGNQRFVTWRK